MNFIVESFKQAFYLTLHLDKELVEIIFLSLRVSLTALLIATILGIPFGAFLGLKNFLGRNAFEKSGVYVLMGPNGSGKSTFLRICATHDSQSAKRAGDIFLFLKKGKLTA